MNAFKNNTITILFFSVLSIFVTKSAIAEESYKENAHYKRVVSAQNKANQSSKIEVLEFFLYACPHCYELEPKLKSWLEAQKDKVTFRRVPAVISANWVTLAKAYYVAESLNILDTSHEALFQAIHKDKRVYLNEQTLSKFFNGQGIKTADFMREFNSQEVIKKVSEARRLSAIYAFRGVPVIVINDEYKTAPFYNKDQDQMIKVMDYLINKVGNKS